MLCAMRYGTFAAHSVAYVICMYKLSLELSMFGDLVRPASFVPVLFCVIMHICAA